MSQFTQLLQQANRRKIVCRTVFKKKGEKTQNALQKALSSDKDAKKLKGEDCITYINRLSTNSKKVSRPAKKSRKPRKSSGNEHRKILKAKKSRCLRGLNSEELKLYAEGKIEPKKGELCRDFHKRLQDKKISKHDGKDWGKVPCKERAEPKKLQTRQLRIINYINKNPADYNGLLVAHGTGCGKTLAAALASQCFLDRHRSKKVFFVCPASLKENFARTLKNDTKSVHFDRYVILSYEQVMHARKIKKPFSCDGGMLIVDEVHNLRTKIVDAEKGKKEQGSRAKAVVDLALTASKRLIMTATPFVNYSQDFVNIINIIYGRIICTAEYKKKGKLIYLSKNVGERSDEIKKIEELLKGRVDFVPDCSIGNSDYPKSHEYYVAVPMTTDFQKKYAEDILPEKEFGEHPEKFYHAVRRAVNGAAGQHSRQSSFGYYYMKIKKAIKQIKKDMKRKGIKKFPQTVFYTNWIKHGVNPLEKYFKKLGLTAKSFTGEIPDKERQNNVKGFNEGEFPVLIVSPAGGEGLDLKRTRYLVVLDPVWNHAGMQQIIGRAARFKSHADLPASEQNVTVLKLVLTLPGVKRWNKGLSHKLIVRRDKNGEEVEEFNQDINTDTLTGDQILYNLVEHKKEVSKEVDAMLESCSVSKGVKPRKFFRQKFVERKKPKVQQAHGAKKINVNRLNKQSDKKYKSRSCKQFKKTKDPKCDDQKDCYWNKGCLKKGEKPKRKVADLKKKVKKSRKKK